MAPPTTRIGLQLLRQAHLQAPHRRHRPESWVVKHPALHLHLHLRQLQPPHVRSLLLLAWCERLEAGMTCPWAFMMRGLQPV